jgi:hypothetical protein
LLPDQVGVTIPFTTVCFAWSPDYAVDDCGTRKPSRRNWHWQANNREKKTAQTSNIGTKSTSHPPLRTHSPHQPTQISRRQHQSLPSSSTAHTQQRSQSEQAKRRGRFRTAAASRVRMRVMERGIASGGPTSLINLLPTDRITLQGDRFDDRFPYTKTRMCRDKRQFRKDIPSESSSISSSLYLSTFIPSFRLPYVALNSFFLRCLFLRQVWSSQATGVG